MKSKQIMSTNKRQKNFAKVKANTENMSIKTSVYKKEKNDLQSRFDAKCSSNKKKQCTIAE